MVLRRGPASEQPATRLQSTQVSRTVPHSDGTPVRPVTPPDEWQASTSEGTVATRSLWSVSHSASVRADGFHQRGKPIRTGFAALDQWIGNGLRQGELLLLGGAPGVGKTTLCLQIARNIAKSAQANVL